MGCKQSKRQACGRLPRQRMLAHYYDETDSSSLCYSPRSAPCSASICHIGVGPSQRCRENDTCHYNRRYRERSRSRSRNFCQRISSDHSCCGCSPAPVASCCTRRCCYPTTQEICAPTPCRQIVNCSPRTKQRCFNCPEYGCCRRAPPSGRGCQRESYPVPLLPRNNHLYLHPLGARCEPLKPCPGQSTCQTVNKNCDDYYPCSPRKLRCTPSGCNRGVGGKRMNVAIHTHVDYDYDADCTTRKKGCLKSPCQKSPCHKPPCQPRCPPGHPYGPRCRQSGRRQSCVSSDTESRCASDDSQFL